MEHKPLTTAEQALADAAFEYHRAPTRGKISITPTKPLSNQRDLSLAYSPGVAYAYRAIEEDPSLVHDRIADEQVPRQLGVVGHFGRRLVGQRG